MKKGEGIHQKRKTVVNTQEDKKETSGQIGGCRKYRRKEGREEKNKNQDKEKEKEKIKGKKERKKDRNK